MTSASTAGKSPPGETLVTTLLFQASLDLQRRRGLTRAGAHVAHRPARHKACFVISLTSSA